MRLGFFFREAGRSMSKSGMPVFSAVLVVFLSLATLGGFAAIALWLTDNANQQANELQLRVYVKTAASETQVNALQDRITKLPGFQRVTYRSPGELLKQQEKKSPNITKGLAFNPLPAAFDVEFSRGADVRPGGESLRGDPAIDTGDSSGGIKDGGETGRTIVKIADYVTYTSIALFIALGLSCVALIANTIRLSIFARRREVEVMKLVGATNWFIRWPFVIEGVVTSLIGAAFAVGALFGVGRFLRYLVDKLSLAQGGRSLLDGSPDFALLAVGVLAVGLVVGALGSALTLGRYLRV